MKIVISTSTFGVYDSLALKRLKKKKIQCALNPYGRQLTEEEVIRLSKGAAGLIAGTEPLTKRVFSSLPDLKVISRCGIGVDNIDLRAAEERHIKIFTTSAGLKNAVAELTVGLILNLLRKVCAMDQNLKKGTWKKETGNLLKGKRVGIVGFGRIGRQVAELFAAFGAEIAFCDVRKIIAPKTFKQKPFGALLRWADIVSLHMNAAKKNSPLMGQKEFKKMKKGSWFVNTARGSAIAEPALVNALKSGRLAGAALDVFQDEPYKGPLCLFKNVILTPHVGSYARESRIAMEKEAVENLIKGLKI